jgi:hypothetical protein
LVEEEVTMDSGEETSVRTSEDSFEVDTEKVIDKYQEKIRLKEENMTEEVKT